MSLTPPSSLSALWCQPNVGQPTFAGSGWVAWDVRVSSFQQPVTSSSISLHAAAGRRSGGTAAITLQAGFFGRCPSHCEQLAKRTMAGE